jgi:predicted metal-dependent hydrolase
MIGVMSLSGTVLRFILPKAATGPEQLTIAHAGDTLPITFVRSPRARRASLRVDPAGRRIVLTAPLRMARATALGFAEAQAGWIAARLKRLPARQPFADGVELPLFGEPHRIRHRADMRGTVWRDGSEIHVAGRPEHLPRRVEDWLKQEARREIERRAIQKAEILGKRIRRITIRDPRGRWGSCSPEGALSFSWRLILAPPSGVVPVLYLPGVSRQDLRAGGEAALSGCHHVRESNG